MAEETKSKTRRKKDEEQEQPATPLSKKIRMRRFYIERMEDESGVSGTGIVMEGCEFSDGKCAGTWYSHLGTATIYDSIKVVMALHGHEGKARLVWIDAEIS